MVRRGVIPEGVIRGRPNPRHEALAKRLRRIREQTERTRKGLADEAGLSHSVVAGIEDESRVPLLDTVEKLARALFISPGWLAYGIDGPPAAAEERGPLCCAEMGVRLRAQRQGRGLSLRALAEEVKLTAGGIGSIETGRTMPSVGTAEALARGLGLSPAWLAYGEGPQVVERARRRRQA